MSVHVLLNLLNYPGERDKMRDLPSIYYFFTMTLINSLMYRSMNVRFYLSYDFKITFF